MAGRHSIRTLVLLALIVVAAAVGFASYEQHTASRIAYEESRTAQELLTAMLDQETGVRGLAITDRESFLEPFRVGRRSYRSAYARARRQVADEPGARRYLEIADAAATGWSVRADEEVDLLRAGRREQALSESAMGERKLLMDRFRAYNKRYADVLNARAERLETRAMVVSVVLVLILGALFSIAATFLTRRNAAARAQRLAREQAFAARQSDLNIGLQVTESEEEAHTFLHRHLEHSIPGSEVVVLKRNNSANRLMPGTPLAPASKLKDAFAEAAPRSCLAIRLAQQRTSSPGQDSVLQCDVCGKLERDVTCSPLLVGGEVIGSVLVGHDGELDDQGRRAVDDSVKQAAPVLANLRNLAIAETRAATDGLTGLPNRRAFEESLRRMVAHANRAMSPLAAVAIDLDHFKQINDVHGHGRGDEVLAEVGALLKSLLRDSDFVSRVGGEEFMALLPDTSRDGALVICERLRTSIQGLEFAALGRDVTASIGVAVLPDDAVDASTLVRAADRMLYAAKEHGRNRVEITELTLGPAPDAATA